MKSVLLLKTARETCIHTKNEGSILKKRSKFIVPFVLITIATLIFVLDGFSILTLNWKPVEGIIKESTTFEYPISTRYKGTRSAYYSNVVVLYSINGLQYQKEIIIDKRMNAGDKVRIRYNPQNIDQITGREINFQWYFLVLSIILTFIIGAIIIKLMEKRSSL
jgi:hypothetical protein